MKTNKNCFEMIRHQQFVLVVFSALLAFLTLTSGQGTNNNNTTTTTNNTTGTNNNTNTTSILNCSTNETAANSGQDCLSCANPTASCPLINGPRCYCNAGYVRSGDDCILARDCPAQACFPNASYASISSNCFTCDNYNTARCALSTVSQCYCNSGYVQDLDNRRCVLPSDCPVYGVGQCRANQTFSSRGYDCDTCTNYQSNRECFVTNQARCYCNVGYVREVGSPRCIRQEDCGTTNTNDCAANQTLANTGYDCATCKFPEAICRPTNAVKCYCLNGYIRTLDGNCVQPQDCSTQLPAGANCRDPWSVGCNPSCIPTCRQRRHGFFRPSHLMCHPACEACFCPTGQVRNDSGDCVPRDECAEFPYNFPNFRYNF